MREKSMRTVAVIGGTGFGTALVAGEPETVETEYGQALLTRAVLQDDLTLLFLARHGAGHTLPPHRINHRANITALRDLGMPEDGIGRAAELAVSAPYPNPRPIEQGSMLALIARAWAGEPVEPCYMQG